MRAIIIGLVVAAVALVGGTVYLLRNYLSEQESAIAAMAPKEPSIHVLVASADIPAGTIVNAGNVAWQGWPEDGVADGYIVKKPKEDAIADLEKDKHVVRRGITAGEPIMMTKLFKQETPGFLRGSLSPGMRAVAVRSAPETASAGFILPGDRVDVMLTHSLVLRALEVRGVAPDGNTPVLDKTSETIMRDVLVLAVDQKVDQFEGVAQISKTILLEVTPKQAEVLTTAREMGKMSLVLRSMQNTEDRDEATGDGYTTDIEVSPMLTALDAILAGGKPGEAKKEPKKKAAAPAPAPRPAASRRGDNQITIYRGVGDTGADAGK